jgi:hypothetical protein
VCPLQWCCFQLVTRALLPSPLVLANHSVNAFVLSRTTREKPTSSSTANGLHTREVLSAPSLAHEQPQRVPIRTHIHSTHLSHLFSTHTFSEWNPGGCADPQWGAWGWTWPPRTTRVLSVLVHCVYFSQSLRMGVGPLRDGCVVVFIHVACPRNCAALIHSCALPPTRQPNHPLHADQWGCAWAAHPALCSFIAVISDVQSRACAGCWYQHQPATCFPPSVLLPNACGAQPPALANSNQPLTTCPLSPPSATAFLSLCPSPHLLPDNSHVQVLRDRKGQPTRAPGFPGPQGAHRPQPLVRSRLGCGARVLGSRSIHCRQ